MLARLAELRHLTGLLSRHRIVGLTGARQVGKSTLARALLSSSPGAFFDLEDSSHLARLSDPLLALRPLRGLIVIDEVQRLPSLFETLRVLADRPSRPARFLILGSASPELIQRSSESLAGRIYYYDLDPLAFDEIPLAQLDRLWLRGGFPRSFCARSAGASFEWRESFLRTFLERDLPELGFRMNSITMRRFWTMLAHYHGQVWNSATFARSFGVSDVTARDYLDKLTAALVVRQLQPWFENLGKRQVRAPKVYIADCGILHSLLNLRSQEDVLSHPLCGASWEGLLISQIVRRLGASWRESYFWATHQGAELDLLIVRGRHRYGFEIKRTSSPTVTKSMLIALRDLKLDRLDVIHAGDDTFPLSDRIRAVAASRLLTDLQPLKGSRRSSNATMDLPSATALRRRSAGS